jgi:hypothetical protein
VLLIICLRVLQLRNPFFEEEKLGEIFNGFQSWQALASVKMEPKIAYRIMKYIRKIVSEYEIIDKQRIALIHEITDTKESEPAKIEPDTQQFFDYLSRFNEVLSIDSDLEPVELYLNEVLEAIYPNQEVSLSPQDMLLLEPFFSEPKCVIPMRDYNGEEEEMDTGGD